MLNDWGVHHLHISSTVEADGFVTRDGPLLFVSFRPNAAYLIDIMSHGDWVRDHVLQVLASEWPNEGVIHKVRDPPSGNPITEGQRANLRGNPYNAAFTFGSKLFMPAGGMMADGTTLAAWRYARQVLGKIALFEQALAANPRCLARDFERHGLVFPETPKFEFVLKEDEPSVVEIKTGALIPLMANQ